METTTAGLLSVKLIDEKLKKEKEYWQQKMSGEFETAGISLDFKRTPVYVRERHTVAFDLEPDTAAALLKISGGKDALVFTILVTALKICLHKLTGVEDVMVGTAIHERYGDVTHLNKVLALRDEVNGDLTVRQLLQNVKTTLSEAYTNQKYPFDRILNLLGLEYPHNRAPLFDVAIIFEGIGSKEHVSHLKHDVTLALSMQGEAVGGTFEYNPGLFKRETLEVFAGHYQTVVRAVLTQPDLEVAAIELLPEAKKIETVFDFNRTQADYPKQAIHKLFEAQVERTPEEVAVVFGQHQLTYRELNRRANQLAHYLRASGIETGSRVGIYMEHSLETLVGIFGVLKAGAAYVPLDVAHPGARIAFTLADAGVPAVLTQRHLAHSLPYGGAKLISLDAEWEQIGAASADNPTHEVGAHETAYVIYTSGSTGNPKGVKIQHGSLVNYVCWAAQVYLKGERLDFPLYSSLAFDLTVTSIYTPLLTGNKVVVYPNTTQESPVVDVLQDNRVGVIKLTPSHLSLIKERDNTQSRIKRIIVGGEAFETELARQVFESFGRQVEIYNEYGPTEATVGCMLHLYERSRDTRISVPIGQPAANTQVYVLDARLNPVADNVTGELYISGDGLAEGYLDQDKLTRERFIPNPFISGQLMYKTGDSVRRLPEGILEFLGRRDEQVKFHGYRVELPRSKTA